MAWFDEQKCYAEKKGSIYETHSLAKGISAVAKPLKENLFNKDDDDDDKRQMHTSAVANEAA